MLPVFRRCGRLALAAVTLAVPAATLVAQVRAPDRAQRVRRTIPERRTEFSLSVGRQQQDAQNALASTTITSLAVRRQLRTEWLVVGARADIGSAEIDGRLFPYERRTVGDTTRYVAVGQSATWTALWATADFLFSVDEDDRYRSGVSTGVGMFGLLPARSPAPGTGNQFGPAAKVGFLGIAELTRRVGVEAGVDATAFFGIDRDKLRASDPALVDPNLATPLGGAPEKKDGVSAALRFHVGLTYRFGVRRRDR
jgi:hypothetical protein